MKEFFLKRIFLFFAFFVFSACDDLSFTDEDIFQPEIKKEIAKETAIPETKNQTSNKETSNISEDSKQISEKEIIVLSEYSKQISEEEITVLSEYSKQISEKEIIVLSEYSKQISEEEITVLSEYSKQISEEEDYYFVRGLGAFRKYNHPK